MISPKQWVDWQALVDYLKPLGNGACINILLEDGPDRNTDYAELLHRFKETEITCEKS